MAVRGTARGRGGPYPALAIAGEQGSAKTVLSKLLRAVIDPSVAPVRALPRDERELFIAASNRHVLAFDNLSGLPPSYRIPSAGWPAAVPFPHVGCSPIRTKFFLPSPAPSFSMGSRISLPAPVLPTALSYF